MSNAAADAVPCTKDPAAVSAFYAEAAGLRRASVQPDHVVLATEGIELDLLAVPKQITRAIEIADPPECREGNPSGRPSCWPTEPREHFFGRQRLTPVAPLQVLETGMSSVRSQR